LPQIPRRQSNNKPTQASIPRKTKPYPRKLPLNTGSRHTTPRQHPITTHTTNTTTTTHTNRHVLVKSESPFIIRIKTPEIHITNDTINHSRSSSREQKRKRPTYQELADTDSDDFLTDSSDDEKGPSIGNNNKRLKKLTKSSPTPEPVNNAVLFGIPAPEGTAINTVTTDANDPNSVEAPPPGVLASLWYSRENVLHIWIMEKILSWKKRPVISLQWKEETNNGYLPLDRAKDVSTKLLEDSKFCGQTTKRMEVSRINPRQCPMVMHAAAKLEATKENPSYTIAPIDPEQKEDVLLVKWRGRSYVHCSWERKRDIEKFDLSNNTARNKIKRFYQNQEVAYGLDWRSVLENERTAPVMTEGSVPEAKAVASEDELFPPQNLEIERILACDEREMDFKIFAKQRLALMKAEEEAMKQRERGEAEGKSLKQSSLFDGIPLVPEGDLQWDPEDYVRYVVKWKGLQYSDIYWEYWKDIKRDAINQAEDFWYRQRSPDPDDVRRLNQRPQLHIREFRKLDESPAYGRSTRPRPIGDGTQQFNTVTEEDKEDKEAHPGFRLRSYQLEGVNWLLFNWWNKRSCILADEMGLGKTIQSVCFLHQLHYSEKTQVRGPFLVVAPLSLISQWQSESQTWSPDLNIIFYHGSADARDFLVQQEFYFTDQFSSKANVAKLRKQHVTKFHILITTYEVVLKDIAVLSKIKWKALIVDEAHRLKNPKARLFEELASVPREFCLLLTGTPLQNSTEELWALLHFSDPVTFKSKEDFVEKFGQLQDSKQVSDLHAVLKPYLLRRVKEDVEKSLPPKEETILEVTLTPIQKAYYKAIYEKNTTFLFKGSKPSNAPSLMNVMMELRKACNHPFLIKGAEERILADAITSFREKAEENGTATSIDHVSMFGDQLIKSSGKMVLLAKLLPKLFDGGHKVLIFSQMVRVLDLLEELLKVKKYRYERLDGSTSASARASAVDRFVRKSCKRFVMLLSTRAGGLGLNLTAADTVIIFDSDWNPQNDLQAMARAHRIGQTRAVRVYRLLTAKTYEMHMFHSASMKLGLSGAVLAQQREGEDGAKSDKGMQAKEIDELLKKGAYDVFRDEDDKEAQKFMETDIDSLLQQSAKTVTYGKTESSISSGLGSFSKASFVADTEDGGKDVDLDDPDFWKKAVGLDAPVETPEELKQMIDDGVKRSRKQVIQYDPYAAFAEAEQKKKDKIALKEKEEKQERARIRLEKRKKKEEERERKRKEREEKEAKKIVTVTPAQPVPAKKEAHVEVKVFKEPKVKKAKRSERSKASRRAENEDPLLERLRQAWDTPQRNRATSGLIRFGFGRFCKLRNDVNLTSLPTHDLEVFARQFIYQIGLFIGVSLADEVAKKIANTGIYDSPVDTALKQLIRKWLGCSTMDELTWICEAIQSALNLQLDVVGRRKSLRLPLTLIDLDYANDMRKGPALRALRRIGILARFTAIMESVLDSILTPIGIEEVAKRSCLGGDLSTLDADLKMRFVTREELSLTLAGRISHRLTKTRAPAAWWDKKCDLALLIGTFVHGFGNYDAMKNDVDLPFAQKISKHMNTDEGCRSAVLMFKSAIAGTRKVFDDALESSKVKSQLEGYAAVAAAVAATKKAETEEAIKDATSGVTEAVSSLDIESDDLHMVTLPRFSKRVVEFVQQRAKCASDAAMADASEGKAEDSSSAPAEEKGRRKRSLENEKLYMPDARVLDTRVLDLIAELEGQSNNFGPTSSHSNTIAQWEVSEDVSTTRVVFDSVRDLFAKIDPTFSGEFHGIGVNGYQCGASHKSLDDGTDYSFCSASAELLNVAQGNDAPRYLRAIGVPITINRYAISSMVHADPVTVEKMVELEKARNYPEKSKESTKKHLEAAAAESDGKPPTNALGEQNDGTKPVKEDEEESKSIPNKLVSSRPDPVLSVSKEGEEYEDNRSEEEAIDPLPSYPPSLVPEAFRDNSKLRASICSTALYFGIPTNTLLRIDPAVVQDLEQDLDSPNFDLSMFSFEKFKAEAQHLADLSAFDDVKMKDYIHSLLLPHCLRLCLSGNGPTTRNTRVSKGTFEAAYGISMFQEPFQKMQVPLPDPTVSASEHSIEAVLVANSILRRVRLIRAAQYAVSGAVSLEQLHEIFASPVASRSMHGLPLWWNPNIHDLGLLISVATSGIFGVVKSRENTVFAPSVIERQVRIAAPSLPDDWVESQVAIFPTANVLERRLALICSEATKHLDNDAFYCHIPMFDHGGWPRN